MMKPDTHWVDWNTGSSRGVSVGWARYLSGLVLLVLGVTLAGCGGSSTTANPTPRNGVTATSSQDGQIQKVPVEGGGSYTDVSVAGLASMLASKNFPLVNVHIPYEGEIDPTDLFIPYNQIESNLDKLPADKSARIVLYCRSGSMSAIAARALVKRGYTDVWNLDGGMIAWQQAGRPIANRGR